MCFLQIVMKCICKAGGCYYVTANDTTRPWNKSSCFIICLFVCGTRPNHVLQIDGWPVSCKRRRRRKKRSSQLLCPIKWTACLCQPLFLLSFDGSHLLSIILCSCNGMRRGGDWIGAIIYMLKVQIYYTMSLQCCHIPPKHIYFVINLWHFSYNSRLLAASPIMMGFYAHQCSMLYVVITSSWLIHQLKVIREQERVMTGKIRSW